jgi:hypothetical protein
MVIQNIPELIIRARILPEPVEKYHLVFMCVLPGLHRPGALKRRPMLKLLQ